MIVCEDGAKLTLMSENLKQKLALDDLTEDSVIDKCPFMMSGTVSGTVMDIVSAKYY